MKILILMTSYKWLLSLREELVDGLLKAGHSVAISGPFDGGEGAFLGKGCKCHDTAVERRGTSVKSDLALLLAYRKLIRLEKPDLVMTFSVKSNIYGGMAARFIKVPSIISITGLGSGLHGGGLLSKLLQRLYRIAMNGAGCVFFQNKSNLQFMREQAIVSPQQHVRLVSGSGVNLTRFTAGDYPASENGCSFLFIGRLMKEKGLDELLAAFSKIREKHPGASLGVLGADEENYLERLRGLPPGSGVTYHGETGDVRPYIAACHCVVLPSYHEGMANVLLEAAASGRPVIASRVPGCAETFDEGVSGLGCEPGDAVSLQKAMEAFLQLPHARRRLMGLAGHDKMVREFDRNGVLDAYLEEIGKVWKKQAAS